MHFSLAMMVPMIVGVIGGVLSRRLFLYFMDLNNKRQAKALVEVRQQQMLERQAARNPYVMYDEFAYADHRDEVIRG